MNRVLSASLTSLVAAGTLFATALPAQAQDSPLSVAGQAMLSNEDRTATITGTFTCNQESLYNVGATLEQVSGLLGTVVGVNTLVPVGEFLPCTGSAQSFQIPVTVGIPPNGHYVVGPAQVQVSATAMNPETGAETVVVARSVELVQ